MFRFHHARRTDFRRGHKHGIGDHQVVWEKPKKRPEHMSESEFAMLPDTLLVRFVCLRLPRRGFRAERIIVVTTLLDAKRYSIQQLTLLYGWRWQAAEINLRHLKTTLHMVLLSAKTPVMVRKEVWTHLLAYNNSANRDGASRYSSRLFPLSTLTPRNPLLSSIRCSLYWLRWENRLDDACTAFYLNK